MKTILRLLALTALLLVGVVRPELRGATLADFGYQHMTVNNVLASGQRPLLIVLADIANNGGTFSHPTPYYDNLIFNIFTNRSLNGFVLENSGGLFLFKRANAGIIGPVTLTSVELTQSATNDQMRAGHCIAAAVRAGFDFSGFDTDGNGVITQDEITILIVENNANGDSGAARWADRNGVGGSFKPPGSSVSFRTSVCFVTQRVSLATLCHEVSHLLGTKDLYGVWNQECLSSTLTLMSCTITWRDNPAIYHLDPWHKMQLGWAQPRIFSLPAGGRAEIPAAQLTGWDKPVLLYDPNRGPSEFFLLEYRTSGHPAGSGFDYDTGVADSGLVVWRVRQEGNHEPSLTPRVDAGPLPAQNLWRFCNKCQGLHHIANADTPVYGACPEGGSHVATNSTAYQVVMNNASAPGQHDWSWCSKCRGMFFGPGQASSRCPAGGTHDGSFSANYSFVQSDSTSPGQHDWRWCRKCQSLFFGPNQASSDCPASGQHDGSISGNYAVLLEGQNLVVWTEGAPSFLRGGTTAWHSDESTPYLHWLDGSPTATRLYVQPFRSSDASITVEWLSESDIWVDFAYPGGFFFPELGTFPNPFNTFAEGIDAVSYGGHLKIKAGSSPETAHVGKRMTIEAYNGPVTIGQ